MKSIKMLGLAALAALMAMAFAGVSSAMAEPTALCEEDTALFNPTYMKTDECPLAKRVSHVHETTLTGAKAKLLNSLRLVECDVLFLGDVKSTNNLATTGETLEIKGNFTYSNCNCTVTEENGPVELKVLREGHETAKVAGKGLVKVVCSGFFTCQYTGEGLVGTGKGPLLSTETNGEVKLSDQLVTNENDPLHLCPDEAKLDIVTTPLTKVYISA